MFFCELKNLNEFINTSTFKAAFEIINRFGIIAVNIVSEVIITLAADIKKYLKKGGSLVCSGIITERGKEVEKALIDAGFKNLLLKHKNEYTAITAEA